MDAPLEEDMMDKSVNSIMTAFVAIVLICSAFIPTVVPLINSVAGLDPTFATLLTTVVTITIVGVIIGVIRGYTARRSAR